MFKNDKKKLKLKRRPDFVQNMLDHENNQNDESINDEDFNTSTNQKLNNSSKKTLTNAEILSQSFLFLSAGYETVATSLCFIAYNLAMNMKYQEKLIEEIDSILEKHVNHLFFFFIFISK